MHGAHPMPTVDPPRFLSSFPVGPPPLFPGWGGFNGCGTIPSPHRHALKIGRQRHSGSAKTQ